MHTQPVIHRFSFSATETTIVPLLEQIPVVQDNLNSLDRTVPRLCFGLFSSHRKQKFF
jgi:hypothetical protein